MPLDYFMLIIRASDSLFDIKFNFHSSICYIAWHPVYTILYRSKSKERASLRKRNLLTVLYLLFFIVWKCHQAIIEVTANMIAKVVCKNLPRQKGL